MNLIRVFSILLFAFGVTAQAEELCLDPLPMADVYETSELGFFSGNGSLILAPGVSEPWLDLRLGLPVAVIRNDRVEVAETPPMDQGNMLPPIIAEDEDGTIWAYPHRFVKGEDALYRLVGGAFVPTGPRGKGVDFAHAGRMRQYDDLTIRHDLMGKGPIFARVEDRLVHMEPEGAKDLPTPPGWRGALPVRLGSYGWAIADNGSLWLSPAERWDWRQVYALPRFWPLGSDGPFNPMQMHVDASGAVQFILQGRVLFGRMVGDWPEFDYDVAGRAMVHVPRGEVLVWSFADQPMPKSDLPRIDIAAGLWKLFPEGPQPVPGDPLLPRMIGKRGDIPYPDDAFHPGAGVTLLAHAGGFAAYDGQFLQDLPQLASEDGRLYTLKYSGGQMLAQTHDRLKIVADDLSVHEVMLPEPLTSLLYVAFSKALGRYLLTSSDWTHLWTSTDLVDFEPASGEGENLKAAVGDMPSGDAAVVIGDNDVYLVRTCR